MELENVTPSEIIFSKKLFASDFSVVFLVTVRNQECVMKVHHGRGPPRYYERKDRELDIHVLETTAYTRLRDKGLCDQGIVPRFLGSMRKFDQSLCQPYLEMFLDDEYPPSAIFLEYIPNMEMITLNNYTQQRMDNLIAGIREIHKTLVLHGDLKPRNMMVVKDDPERVIWIDFDRAATYEEASITDSEKSLLEDEEITLVYFKQFMENDLAKGKLEDAYIFYCT
ncbi:hypothetical protein DTO027B5_6505 [Paecilomyces variotii]|nr:hypothetical protein DTO169C6_2560 [Paecilomyces variotii]KAJ9251868.1 hypothetical protein DTO207G8_5083 [Paecilomyces variotii]KAJ9263564.1 hypothetical protein DTO195F2_2824 [Paecilomyces variotii]KAJ9325236.1 hypothetical protein DTO027B3_3715 [Paecilomyces variotii]KAJ9331685.1 hypothetical protein DTO027B5_6505 [Paecilomyces variotii]